ncbi:hypothetical protein ASPVEDRAFT_67519 [Aspergillus versicolor CBS 583.65]|uniref:Uncharacterized protein n=1 Tax=Aspergillus versicolor CBS 583.65 TaxID=1036611 RepID=A0A1L9P576_ASPVE|nr:uncharacterized protein ASPVEDRAFT_67519 [Aspergillus versicolor CBS 583.65]OJI96646.1 hypothetical protein ASPVEDRAFT_67519 [Aspergillus versicolor CBS 583.65]
MIQANTKTIRIRAYKAGNWELRNRSLTDTAGLAAGDPIEQLHPPSQLVLLGPGSFALHVLCEHTSPGISIRPAADLPARRVVWARREHCSIGPQHPMGLTNCTLIQELVQGNCSSMDG